MPSSFSFPLAYSAPLVDRKSDNGLMVEGQLLTTERMTHWYLRRIIKQVGEWPSASYYSREPAQVLFGRNLANENLNSTA